MATKKRNLAMNIMTKLTAEVEKRGGGERNLRYLLTVQGQPLLGRLADMIVNAILNCMQISIDTTVPYKRDMTDEKAWILSHEKDALSGDFQFELEEVICPGEPGIFAREMMKRAEGKDCLRGQKCAERLIDNWQAVPVEWQKYNILFPGTAWQESLRGRRYIPALRFVGSRWILVFRWLGGTFGSNCRFIRAKRQK